jgi:hypothetical protein
MPGWKTWAALEEVTAANMNSFVRDQTVQVFTNSSARSAAITAPTRGLVSLLTDSGALEIYYGATTGWAKPWNQPYGFITEASNGANVNASSGVWTAATTATHSQIAGRRVQVTGIATIINGATPSEIYVGVGPTLGTPARLNQVYLSANFRATIAVEYIMTTTGASVTERLQFVGVGSATTALAQAHLVITDLGPATATAPTS